MLASLALISLLQTPVAGADGLSLANPRITHGALGPVRANASLRPGDSLHLAFDIQGIGTDNTGKASYSTAVDVIDAGGNVIFKQPAKKFQEFLPLGGATAPAFAEINLGLDSPAGKYAINVTVTDLSTGKAAAVKQDFSVEPKAFDLVRLSISGDADGLVPMGAYATGQPFWVHAAVVGFDRAATGTKQPKVDIQLSVLGPDQKPLIAQPFTGTVDKDVASNATSLPVRFFVPLNRPGSYTVQLTAKDGLGKGTATLSFPITVLPAK